MITKSNALLTSIPSLITSYVGDEENPLQKTEEAVSDIWKKTWLEADPKQFVGWLIHEGVIDLREMEGHITATNVNVFSRFLVPLLLEVSSSSPEKEFLYDLANRLKASCAFVNIFPTIGRELKFDSRCTVLGQNNFTQKADGSGPIDSYWVQLNLDIQPIQILVDDQGAWHFGSVSTRSYLLHELAHVFDGVTDPHTYFLNHTCKSHRWTNANEESAIQKENTYLKARGELTRLSHNGYFQWEEFLAKPIGSRLLDALSYGADGSVRQLAVKQIEEGMLPEEYGPIQIASEHHWVGYYNAFYLTNRTEQTTIVSPDIDLPYLGEYLAHKNRALEILVTSLIDKHPNGSNLANQLIETILQTAPKCNRLDVVPFIEELQAKICK